MAVRVESVSSDFYRFLSSLHLPTVEKREVERYDRGARWTEVHYFLANRELTSGVVVYDAWKSFKPPLYVESNSRLRELEEEYKKNLMTRGVVVVEKTPSLEELERKFRPQHEARLRGLVEDFEKYCQENAQWNETLERTSEADWLIAQFLVASGANSRLDDIIREIYDKLFAIEPRERMSVIEDLKRRAVYLDADNFDLPKVEAFLPLEIRTGRKGDVIGRKLTYLAALVYAGVWRHRGSLKLLRMFGGKVAVFKCPPPSGGIVLAVRYVEKEKVIVVHEWLPLELQELLKKREYLKRIEKLNVARRLERLAAPSP